MNKMIKNIDWVRNVEWLSETTISVRFNATHDLFYQTAARYVKRGVIPKEAFDKFWNGDFDQTADNWADIEFVLDYHTDANKIYLTAYADNWNSGFDFEQEDLDVAEEDVADWIGIARACVLLTQLPLETVRQMVNA